ncbi:hypothetical protein [Burkholderia sp. LMG 32019]
MLLLSIETMVAGAVSRLAHSEDRLENGGRKISQFFILTVLKA